MQSAQTQLREPKTVHTQYILIKEEKQKYVLHKISCSSIKYQQRIHHLTPPTMKLENAKKIASQNGQIVYYCALCFDENQVNGKMYRG